MIFSVFIQTSTYLLLCNWLLEATSIGLQPHIQHRTFSNIPSHQIEYTNKANIGNLIKHTINKWYEQIYYSISNTFDMAIFSLPAVNNIICINIIISSCMWKDISFDIVTLLVFHWNWTIKHRIVSLDTHFWDIQICLSISVLMHWQCCEIPFAGSGENLGCAEACGHNDLRTELKRHKNGRINLIGVHFQWCNDCTEYEKTRECVNDGIMPKLHFATEDGVFIREFYLCIEILCISVLFSWCVLLWNAIGLGCEKIW